MGVKRSYRFAQGVNGQMNKKWKMKSEKWIANWKLKIEKTPSFQIIPIILSFPITPIAPELLSAEGH